MKPKDLKCPHHFDNRRPELTGGVLFVPVYYQAHESFVMPSWEELFGNSRQVNIEYCSGNGDWIADKAQAHPEINWVAVEKQFDRVRKVWSKRENRNISNLFIVAGAAEPFTRHYVSGGTIAEAYVNFPDPWPKRSHAKHRLMAPQFLQDLKKALVKGGGVTLATDDPDTCCRAVDLLLKTPGFSPAFPFPHYVHTWEGGYGSSRFEQLWRSLEKEIHYVRFTAEASYG